MPHDSLRLGDGCLALASTGQRVCGMLQIGNCECSFDVMKVSSVRVLTSALVNFVMQSAASMLTGWMMIRLRAAVRTN